MHFCTLVLPLAFFSLMFTRLCVLCSLVFYVFALSRFWIWTIKLILFPFSLFYFPHLSSHSFSLFFFFPFYFFLLSFPSCLLSYCCLLALCYLELMPRHLVTLSCCLFVLPPCYFAHSLTVSLPSLPLHLVAFVTLLLPHYLVTLIASSLPCCFIIASWSYLVGLRYLLTPHLLFCHLIALLLCCFYWLVLPSPSFQGGT